MKKLMITALGVGAITLLAGTILEASMINYERRNRSLRAAEGNPVTEKEELPGWMKSMPRVKEREERRYDLNRDGYLQTAEVKIFLRDIIEEVNDKGSYTIDSKFLSEYDQNRDGVITRYEIADIQNDVK